MFHKFSGGFLQLFTQIKRFESRTNNVNWLQQAVRHLPIHFILQRNLLLQSVLFQKPFKTWFIMQTPFK